MESLLNNSLRPVFSACIAMPFAFIITGIAGVAPSAEEMAISMIAIATVAVGLIGLILTGEEEDGDEETEDEEIERMSK